MNRYVIRENYQICDDINPIDHENIVNLYEFWTNGVICSYFFENGIGECCCSTIISFELYMMIWWREYMPHSLCQIEYTERVIWGHGFFTAMLTELIAKVVGLNSVVLVLCGLSLSRKQQWFPKSSQPIQSFKFSMF